MRDHYQVKFQQDGKTIYGIFSEDGTKPHASPESKKWAKKGKVLVADAILPKTYAVAEKDLIDIPLSNEYDPKRGCMKDELSLYVSDELDKAQKLSDSKKTFQPGKMFTVGVADGSAFYVVTYVDWGKKTCQVEWRGFCPDRYTCQILGWGGTFPVSAIKPQVDRADGLKAIFGAKKD